MSNKNEQKKLFREILDGKKGNGPIRPKLNLTKKQPNVEKVVIPGRLFRRKSGSS